MEVNLLGKYLFINWLAGNVKILLQAYPNDSYDAATTQAGCLFSLQYHTLPNRFLQAVSRFKMASSLSEIHLRN